MIFPFPYRIIHKKTEAAASVFISIAPVSFKRHQRFLDDLDGIA